MVKPFSQKRTFVQRQLAVNRAPVLTLWAVVAEVLGRARRDSFQEFKKLHDPDAIVALSRPVWETHGLSKGQAKELAIRHFAPGKK
jgi:hypothetical protein